LGLILWLCIQAFLSFKHVYSGSINSLPPKIVLFGVLPNIIFIALLFFTKSGRHFIDGLPIKNLTYLHSIRIPVEIVLWYLFLNKTIPEEMTFDGRNFDILAGLTAPLIAYAGFSNLKLNKAVILIWNFICLGLLINIGVIGFLSAPTPFQKFGFEQPNIALLYFPFSWLISFIVPMVLFAHLVSIKQLIKYK
ncbi:MAG TPA: hypothetical protein PLU10_11500, partial [Chitinophagaceae bacterium]|nr:hypothetical protein [Chitinophagaceae bacterium]